MGCDQVDIGAFDDFGDDRHVEFAADLGEKLEALGTVALEAVWAGSRLIGSGAKDAGTRCPGGLGAGQQLILCERGIRTFETATRNTLDLAAVPLLKAKSHLPVLVDPSHATGIRELVIPMALAAAAAGADGVMVEVHIHPPSALSDGPQSLFPEQMLALGRQLDAMLGLLGRSL
jgi:hypothetical protein